MNELTALIKQIELVRAEITHLLPNPKWSNEFTEQVKLDFTFHNNKIEDNKITYGQTISFLKEATTPRNISIKDCLDIKNHYEILDSIFNSANQPLSESFILELHKKLMKDEVQWKNPDDYSPGKYKWATNYTIREGEKIHWYMDYKLVGSEIDKLITEINKRLNNTSSESNQNHPLHIITYFHNRFLGEIHPFADGNGRICRIIMNQVLINKNYSPIFIKDTDRKNYFKLFEISDSSNTEAMAIFLGQQLLESMNIKHQYILKVQQR